MQSMLGLYGLSGGELLLILLILVVVGGIVLIGLASAAYFLFRASKGTTASTPPTTAQKPSPIPGTEEPPARANMAGTQFHHVTLAGADFRDADLSNARFSHVDLSNATITAAQLGGAVFKQVAPPPQPDGRPQRQRPVRFEEMMLCDSTFRQVDLSNVRVTDCDLTGMTINGLLVTDLISAYQRQHGEHPGNA